MVAFIAELSAGHIVPEKREASTTPQKQASEQPENLTEKQPQVTGTEKVSPKATAESEKKSPIPITPAASDVPSLKARSALSIANMLAAGNKPKGQDGPKEAVLSETFSQEDLIKAWEHFCEKAGKEKRIGLHTAMNAADVHIGENNVVEITVSSSPAAHELEQNMLDILAFLKKTLRNTIITHRVTINESVREHLPYTPREKYEYLRLKNPLLEKMRNELDLNIDF